AGAVAGGPKGSGLVGAAYRGPQAGNAVGKAVGDPASSAMDVSDGLAGDLTKLCTASGVSAVIDVPSIPTSATAATLLSRGVVGFEALIAGGDDYEILCTVPEGSSGGLEAAAREAGIAVTAIGTVMAGGGGAPLLFPRGREIALARQSWSHF